MGKKIMKAMGKVTTICFLMLIILGGINLVSAFSFDNVKEFNQSEGKFGKAIIKNSFGFGEKLAEVELLENSHVCVDNLCYAEGKTILEKKGELIEEVEFEINKNSIKNFRIYIKEKNKWILYNGESLEKGTYFWKIEGEIENGKVVDWVGTWEGVKVEEWMEWSSEYQIRINATSINEVGLEINGVSVTDEGNGIYKLNTSETYEVSRALIMKTLFYGTSGSDPRAVSAYVNASNVYSVDSRDIGRRGTYSKNLYTNGGGYDDPNNARAWTGTFENTIDNYNVSSWSHVWGAGYGGYDTTEIGTDTSADQTNNPATARLYTYIWAPNGWAMWQIPAGTTRLQGAGSGYAADYAKAESIILHKGNISWVRSTTLTGPLEVFEYTDFYLNESFPLFESIPTITINGPNENDMVFKDKNITFNITSLSETYELSSIKLYIDEIFIEEKSISGNENTTIFNKTVTTTENHNWNVVVEDTSGNNRSSDTYNLYTGIQINITSAVDGSELLPDCSLTNGIINDTLYWNQIEENETTNLYCELSGFANTNFSIFPNETTINLTMNEAYLNLTFSELTNASIYWLGDSLSYSNTTNVTIPLKYITELGNIQVNFNDETQIFSFINDNKTDVVENLLLEDVDFDQPVKVLDSNQEIKDALITFYKEGKITYSAFTDINGIAHILINDGTTYEIHGEKEGYESHSELRYIPTSNTDTIIINLHGATTTGEYYFSQSCLNVVGYEQNCTWSVISYKDTTINFNYTWSGSNYSVSSSGSRANLTLLVNSTTAPVFVTASVNPTKTYNVSWSDIGARDIQLNFDEDEIKDESIGVLILFYLIIFIVGIIFMVIVNEKIPKMEGNGVYAMTIWFGIMAFDFPLLWFIVTPIAIFKIVEIFWGDNQ